MASTNNGGPAFPLTYTRRNANGVPIQVVADGMPLRDYFAAKALQGLIASFAGTTARLPEPQSIATDAYEQADAMLKARETDHA